MEMSMWLWTIAAPAPRHRRASEATSSDRRGTKRLCSCELCQLMAASMMTGPSSAALGGDTEVRVQAVALDGVSPSDLPDFQVGELRFAHERLRRLHRVRPRRVGMGVVGLEHDLVGPDGRIAADQSVQVVEH